MATKEKVKLHYRRTNRGLIRVSQHVRKGEKSNTKRNLLVGAAAIAGIGLGGRLALKRIGQRGAGRVIPRQAVIPPVAVGAARPTVISVNNSAGRQAVGRISPRQVVEEAATQVTRAPKKGVKPQVVSRKSPRLSSKLRGKDRPTVTREVSETSRSLREVGAREKRRIAERSNAVRTVETTRTGDLRELELTGTRSAVGRKSKVIGARKRRQMRRASGKLTRAERARLKRRSPERLPWYEETGRFIRRNPGYGSVMRLTDSTLTLKTPTRVIGSRGRPPESTTWSEVTEKAIKGKQSLPSEIRGRLQREYTRRIRIQGATTTYKASKQAGKIVNTVYGGKPRRVKGKKPKVLKPSKVKVQKTPAEKRNLGTGQGFDPNSKPRPSIVKGKSKARSGEVVSGSKVARVVEVEVLPKNYDPKKRDFLLTISGIKNARAVKENLSTASLVWQSKGAVDTTKTLMTSINSRSDAITNSVEEAMSKPITRRQGGIAAWRGVKQVGKRQAKKETVKLLTRILKKGHLSTSNPRSSLNTVRDLAEVLQNPNLMGRRDLIDGAINQAIRRSLPKGLSDPEKVKLMRRLYGEMDNIFIHSPLEGYIDKEVSNKVVAEGLKRMLRMQLLLEKLLGG